MGKRSRGALGEDPGDSDSRYGGLLLLALTIPHFAVTMAGQAPGLLAPWMMDSLDLSRAELGSLTSTRFLGSSMMFIASGTVVARLGISAGLVTGLVAFGLAFAVAGAGSSLLWLLVLLFVAGAGFALVHPATTAGIVSGFPAAKRATVMGLKETGVPTAGVIAPWLLPLVALHVGWRAAFVVCGALAVVAAAVVWALLRRAAWAHTKVRFGVGGRSLSFSGPVLVTGLLQLLLLGIQFCVLTYLLLYLLDAVGLPLSLAVLVVAATQAGSFLWRFGVGVVTDRVFHGRNDVVVGLIFLSVGVTLLLLAQVTADTGTAWLVLLGVVLGGATQGWPGPLLLLRSELATSDEAVAQVTAAGFAVGAWGAIVVPPVFGYVVDWTGSYDVAWIGSAVVLAAVGVVMVLHAMRRDTADVTRTT